MRLQWYASVLLLMVGCQDGPATDATLPKTVAGSFDENSQEPRFEFVAPDGFEWRDDHQLWYNNSIRTSISLAHAPATSFESVADDFTAERMLEAHMELLSADVRDVAGRKTLLVHANRLNGKYPQQVCTVAFATSTGSAQLTAIHPTSLPDEVKSRIETALLNAKFEEPR